MDDRFDRLCASADRFDSLAETAELMGDDFGAAGFHAEATRCRTLAMSLLDD